MGVAILVPYNSSNSQVLYLFILRFLAQSLRDGNCAEQPLVPVYTADTSWPLWRLMTFNSVLNSHPQAL